MSDVTSVLLLLSGQPLHRGLADALGHRGFNVATASTGHHAQSLIERRAFDVVLGLAPDDEALGLARRSGSPLVVLSERPAREVVLEGAHFAVQKPVGLSELERVLNRAVAEARWPRQASYSS